MKHLEVSVKPKAGFVRVEKISERSYRVWVKAAPEKGKANEAVCEALAEYFQIAKSSVRVVKGETAKKKWIDIAA